MPQLEPLALPCDVGSLFPSYQTLEPRVRCPRAQAAKSTCTVQKLYADWRWRETVMVAYFVHTGDTTVPVQVRIDSGLG